MTPSSQIAHYRITAKLGEGGMGAVYRATDTKLNREVAIKVLPEAFAQDTARMARFEREAHVLASLNHPNIAQIYGIEEGAIVMELVEGADLAGPVALETAIAYAKQIAAGLEAAHEKGIVHRDLKPANIKVTPGGNVKVLDFGLAKAGASPSGSPLSSPTLTAGATQMGTILGTAAYMSPEQARGQEVDKRADIWAFGVVLFEMFTGRRVFDGVTIPDTLAAVLRAEIDWSCLPAEVPLNLHTLLRRCLERDPRKRLRDIGDARLELENPVPAPAASRKSAVLPWVLAAAGLLAASTLAILYVRSPPAPAPTVRFNVFPPPKGSFGNVLAISPDGHYLAFPAATDDGKTHIWIRALDSLEARPLAGTDRSNITSIFWSPDNRYIVVQGELKIMKVPIDGGAAQSLCDAPNVMLGGSWNADGVIIFGTNTGSLMRVSAAGGVATPVTRVEQSRGEMFHSDPIFLPDGRHFLYFRHSVKAENQGVYAGSLDVKPEDQSLKRIQAVDFSPGFAPARGGKLGRLFFLRDETLMAQPFDTSRLETAGEAVPIVDHVGTILSRAFFSVSTGVLVYRGGTAAVRLAWYDREGHSLGNAGEPGDYEDLAISPDGSRVAFSGNALGAGRQIWILDLARGNQTRFTFVPDGARSPVWSPDGRYLAFGEQTRGGIHLKELNTNSEAQQITGPGSTNDWSPDGRYLIYQTASGRGDLMALPNPTETPGPPIVIANSEFTEGHGQVSPDSRWIAYDSNETGRLEVYVMPFPPGDGRSGKSLVSTNGGSEPRWRHDGKELYYLDPSRTLMAAPVTLGKTFQSGTPQRLFSAGAINTDSLTFQYNVTRDGNRFLLISPAEGAVATPASVVINWNHL